MKKTTLKEKRRRIAGSLPDLAELVRGSVVKRFLRCGKEQCQCHQSRGHGPYYYLMTTLGRGNTRMQLISGDQVQIVRRWIRNFRAYRKGLEKILEVNAGVLQVDRQEAKLQTAKSRTGRRRVKG